MLSAFFSAAETGMMSINRYRLKHLAKTSKNAKRVHEMLQRPDRFLGMVLLGNTFFNIFTGSLATVIAIELFGEQWGVIAASAFTTVLLLIFAELCPKTLAALYPEKIALPASLPVKFFLTLCYPLVWATNTVSNGILKMLGVSFAPLETAGITPDELRTIVHETTGRIPSKHRKMLLSILDLEKVAVDNIMVPRTEIIGLDINNEWDAILAQLAGTQHTFLPVYQGDLNNVIGFIHAKRALNLMADKEFNLEKLKGSLDDPLFVPEGTSLTRQMINFQKAKKRFALVVDEYGDILGLVTLDDILEEIVGEFTTNISVSYSLMAQEDGSYLVDGATTIREFNREAKWTLPLSGPKTISGLVIDYLQDIPSIGTCCLIEEVPIEVVSVQDNRIKTLKIFPPLKPQQEEEESI
jgi:Mg2+/Co2+ transporter CorB